FGNLNNNKVRLRKSGKRGGPMGPPRFFFERLFEQERFFLHQIVIDINRLSLLRVHQAIAGGIHESKAIRSQALSEEWRGAGWLGCWGIDERGSACGRAGSGTH